MYQYIMLALKIEEKLENRTAATLLRQYLSLEPLPSAIEIEGTVDADATDVANKKSTEKADAGVGAVGGTTGIGIVGHETAAEAEPPSPLTPPAEAANPLAAVDLKEVLVQAERRGHLAMAAVVRKKIANTERSADRR